MKHHPLQTLAVALLLVGFSLAQDTKSLDRGARKGQGETFDSSDLEEGKPDEAVNDPHAPRGGARGYCTFKGSVQPRRIAPGSSGTLMVTMMLQGHWVMTSPANMAFEFEPRQGAISVGQPVLRPARPGMLDTALKGMPVYDHYAIIDIPITVSSDARFGEHHVRVRGLFDIADGRTGAHFQRFLDTFGGIVEVGEPIPENLAPRLQSGPEAAMRPVPQAGEPTATAPAGPAPGNANAGPRSMDPGQVLPVDPSAGAEIGTAPATTQLGSSYGNGTDAGGGVSWVLIAGIGGFALVLLVVIVGLVKRG